jgi:hypothetical protein
MLLTRDFKQTVPDRVERDPTSIKSYQLIKITFWGICLCRRRSMNDNLFYHVSFALIRETAEMDSTEDDFRYLLGVPPAHALKLSDETT